VSAPHPGPPRWGGGLRTLNERALERSGALSFSPHPGPPRWGGGLRILLKRALERSGALSFAHTPHPGPPRWGGRLRILLKELWSDLGPFRFHAHPTSALPGGERAGERRISVLIGRRWWWIAIRKIVEAALGNG